MSIIFFYNILFEENVMREGEGRHSPKNLQTGEEKKWLFRKARNSLLDHLMRVHSATNLTLNLVSLLGRR